MDGTDLPLGGFMGNVRAVPTYPLLRSLPLAFASFRRLAGVAFVCAAALAANGALAAAGAPQPESTVDMAKICSRGRCRNWRWATRPACR